MSRNAETLAALEPQLVWKLFAGLADSPRPSKREGKARAYLLTVARERGLQVVEDEIGNLILHAPATEGRESAPRIVLQAHIDMVCEKNSDQDHDFDNDPIRLVLDERDGKQIVRADGTTLGADNGVGVALALAAACDADVQRGPLEILLTVDEEAGMSGVRALTPDSLRGRRLINLDTEEDDAFYIGCAGGADTTLIWDFSLAPLATPHTCVCNLRVRGLRGGHSGMDIVENRAAATRLLARLLLAAPDARLVRIEGGSKRNAIAREASATIVISETTQARLRSAAERLADDARRLSFEPEARIEVSAAPAPDEALALSQADTARLVQGLIAAPHGVIGMHPRVPGLVETSTNLATLRCERSRDGRRLLVSAGSLTRSSATEWKDAVREQLAAVAALTGASLERGSEYGGWAPNVDSPTLGVCKDVYQRLYGAAPRVAAIHAGLECGIIGERIPGMDMVSLGPTIRGAHSPDEHVYVESVQKSWRLLLACLEALSSDEADNSYKKDRPRKRKHTANKAC